MMRCLYWPLALVATLGAAAVLGAPEAAAAPVRGTVSLPPEFKVPRRFVGHWRVDYASVASQSSSPVGTVVLVTSAQAQAVVAGTASVEIVGLQANPSVVVVGEGSVVEFRNSDKVAHDLSIPGRTDLMPPARLGAGSIRKQRFGAGGEFVVRCSEYPHIVVSIIVTSSPFFDLVDDKGHFKLADVPEGKATLKVWSHDRWVHEQEIDVPAKGLELAVKVSQASGKEPAE